MVNVSDKNVSDEQFAYSMLIDKLCVLQD